MRLVFVLLLAALPVSAAEVVIAHSGRLLDAQDVPVNAQVEMTFSLHAFSLPVAQDAVLWEESYPVQVIDGLYGVSLGDTAGGKTVLPFDLFVEGEAL